MNYNYKFMKIKVKCNKPIGQRIYKITRKRNKRRKLLTTIECNAKENPNSDWWHNISTKQWINHPFSNENYEDIIYNDECEFILSTQVDIKSKSFKAAKRYLYKNYLKLNLSNVNIRISLPYIGHYFIVSLK